MTGINTYSTTPANNVNANTGINWDEGMSPAAVNNSARQNMADTRAALNDLIWFRYGKGDGPDAVSYASATSLTVAGVDVTAVYHAGRRIKAVGSGTGTIYGTISSSSFSTNTTINISWDSGSLTNESLNVYLSQVPVAGSPLGDIGVIHNQNAATAPSVTNSDSGAAAYAAWRATNGNDVCDFGVLGTGYTTSGALAANRSFIASNETFVLTVQSGRDTICAIDGGEKWRFANDGSFLVGTSTLAGAGNIADAIGNVRNIPLNIQASTYSLVAGDNGKQVLPGGNVTVGSGLFVGGNVVLITNASGAPLNIVQGSGVTLILAGTATTGTRALAVNGVCTLQCIGSNTFMCYGPGVT